MWKFVQKTRQTSNSIFLFLLLLTKQGIFCVVQRGKMVKFSQNEKLYYRQRMKSFVENLKTKENSSLEIAKVRHGRRRQHWTSWAAHEMNGTKLKIKIKRKEKKFVAEFTTRVTAWKGRRRRRETLNLHNDYANYVSLELGRFPFFIFSVSFSIYSRLRHSMCCSQFTFNSELLFHFLFPAPSPSLFLVGVRTLFLRRWEMRSFSCSFFCCTTTISCCSLVVHSTRFFTIVKKRVLDYKF